MDTGCTGAKSSALSRPGFNKVVQLRVPSRRLIHGMGGIPSYAPLHSTERCLQGVRSSRAHFHRGLLFKRIVERRQPVVYLVVYGRVFHEMTGRDERKICAGDALMQNKYSSPAFTYNGRQRW